MLNQIEQEPAGRAFERADQSHVVFREVNERISALTGVLAGLEMHLLVCECSDDACAESIEITPAEYEAVRGHGDRFLVLPGHHLPAVEQVVDGNDRFLVVEKLVCQPVV